MLLILLVVWLGLCLLMGAGALFLQGYLNESPPSPQDLAWRAPAAGTLVAVFFGFWCFLATRNPDRFGPLFEPPASQEKYYDSMKIVKGRETRVYVKRKNEQGRVEYRDQQNNAILASQPDEVIVSDDGVESTFRPDRDAKGNPKIEYGGRLRYRDEKGRVMEEGFLGQLATGGGGGAFLNILLSVVHWGVWLGALWPILRFSFWQAFAISLGTWLTTVLVIMPPLLNQARRVHDARVKAEKSAARDRPETTEGREDLAILPPLAGVRPLSHPVSGRALNQSGGRTSAGHLAATVAGNSILTFTSWPAVTLTRSSRTSPLNSALTL